MLQTPEANINKFRNEPTLEQTTKLLMEQTWQSLIHLAVLKKVVHM